jgi:hypothetical protein
VVVTSNDVGRTLWAATSSSRSIRFGMLGG